MRRKRQSHFSEALRLVVRVGANLQALSNRIPTTAYHYSRS